MKVVNNLIFNSLIKRKDINLPQIGSLRVEHRAAHLKGKKRLEFPVTRIVYSKNEIEGAISVIDLIEQESGVDRKKAKELYNKWLSDVILERVVTIEGVGRIKNDFFTPSAELSMIVNPETKSHTKLDRRVGMGVVAAIVLPLILVLATGYYLAFVECVFESGFESRQHQIATVPTQLIAPKPIIIASDSDSVRRLTADSSIVSATPPPERSASSTVSTMNGVDGASTANASTATTTSTTTKYHVISGVYSTLENANTYIAKARIKADTLPYKVLSLANGKFLISIFETGSEKSATKRKNELHNADPSLWVHKAPAGSKN